MKSFRFYLVLAFLAVSIFFIVSPYLSGRAGVVVTSVNGSSCGGMSGGDVITRVGDRLVGNPSDFSAAESSAIAGTYYPMIVNGGPGGCVALSNGNFGIDVSGAKSGGIKFDKSIVGGVKVVVTPKSQMSDADLQTSESIMRSRIAMLKLSGVDIALADGKIFMDAPSVDELGILIKRGNLEGTVRQALDIRSNSSEVKIGINRYLIERGVDGIVVNSSDVQIGQNFYLQGIRFTLANMTNVSAVIDALIFQSQDIIRSLPSYGSVVFDSAAQMYRFTLPVELSERSGIAFGEVSDGLSTYTVGQDAYLNGLLRLVVDGDTISEVGIPVNFAGTNVSTLSLIGYGKNMDDVLARRSYVEVAAAGRLPGEFNFDSISSAGPSNGWMLWLIPATVAGLAAFGMGYQAVKRRIKASAVVVIMLAVEAAYIFGEFAIAQRFVNWYIDAYAVIGVCAVLAVLAFDMLLGRQAMVKTKDRIVMSLAVAGIVLMFTPFKGLGIALFFGLGMNRLLTKKFYESML